MAATPLHEPPVDRRLIDALWAAADPEGCLSFRDYMAVTLYAPEVGYYRQSRQRVARQATADFYTATSLGRVFYPLMHAAAVTLLNGADPAEYTLVEIGVEPGCSTPVGPFGAVQSLTLEVVAEGSVALPAKTVLLANEILDAQPFHRLILQDGHWHELGVRIDEDGNRQEVRMADMSPALAEWAKSLPNDLGNGYIIDIALEAESWLQRWLEGTWEGLVILPDYGRSLHELLEACPAGTARGYFRHRRVEDLLALPGLMDLTCDVCWDRIEAVLAHYCSRQGLERQEAFFMHHAAGSLESLFREDPEAMGALRELLHPAMMGHRFQVLWGRVDRPQAPPAS